MIRHGAHKDVKRLRIVGTDVDTHALADASRGRYTSASFVDTAPAVVDKYFPVENGLHTVSAEIRNLVHFERHDLLEGGGPGGRMHLIICRNVVIYFDKVTQAKLFSRIADKIKPGGWLYIGHSENLAHVCDRFKLCGRTIYQRIK